MNAPEPLAVDPALERLAVDVVRGLSMDAVHAARSGHQGTAMALAPLAHVLFSRIMRYDAADPTWPDRDRLVLSGGHASILLYSYLFLTGHGLELDDLRAFRQWGSRTPGHPEAGHTAGVEVTTGPLGQGLGNAVGMAIAERWLRATFGADLFDHRIWVIAGDGDLMEGISHEAASLAGHLGLGRLVVVYDDNRITIDGSTDLALSDDAAARFRAYGWHVIELGEAAEDLGAMEAALRDAASVEDRPTLVVLRSHIGYPSPRTDDHAAHGYALLDDEIRTTKATLGLPPEETFHVPSDVLDYYRSVGTRGSAIRSAWEQRFAAGRDATLDACLASTGLPGWDASLPTFGAGEQIATRVAFERCLAAVAEVVPGLLGGGADLTGNTGTRLPGAVLQSSATPHGRQIAFGVREHAMAATSVGMARHGGVIPFGGTFLVFADYARPSVRLAALSGAKVLFVWSHDSVGVGEDGPTHQPVEQVASLRVIPGLVVLRPADATETAGALRAAIDHDGPTALVLTRQNVPVLDGTDADAVITGGYVVRPSGRTPDVVLVATGSEVHLCVEAAAILDGEGVAAQVVSLPSWELFARQSAEHRAAVLPAGVRTIAVEAGSSFGWDRYADEVIGIDRFGASAPGAEVLRRFGFTAEAIAERVRRGRGA